MNSMKAPLLGGVAIQESSVFSVVVCCGNTECMKNSVFLWVVMRCGSLLDVVHGLLLEAVAGGKCDVRASA